MTEIETVADLIEALGTYDRDTPVRIQARAGQSRRSVRNLFTTADEETKVIVCGW